MESVSQYEHFKKFNDFGLNTSRGDVSGFVAVNKFGRAPDGVQTTATDIWSRSDSAATQRIWVAPTTARVHAIVSSSASDAAGGTGATAVKIYGLTSWTAAEVNETVTLTGTTPVNTVNSYVIIHRMVVVSQATTTNVGVNAGIITATAATDATITAVILASRGQTEMAVYGIPSTQTLFINCYYGNLHDITAAGAKATMFLMVNDNPSVQKLGFLTKHSIGCVTTGTTGICKQFHPPNKISGPAIIKIQCIGSGADLDFSAGFDAYLVTN